MYNDSLLSADFQLQGPSSDNDRLATGSPLSKIAKWGARWHLFLLFIPSAPLHVAGGELPMGDQVFMFPTHADCRQLQRSWNLCSQLGGTRSITPSLQSDCIRIAVKRVKIGLTKVCMATNHAHPVLESFNLFPQGTPRYDFPCITLRVGSSAPSLRSLVSQHVPLAPLSRLISSTTSLVNLTLDIDSAICPSPAGSLLTHLQGMPCLCHLLHTPNPLPAPPTFLRGQVILSHS
jgi:hypothetical protein